MQIKKYCDANKKSIAMQIKKYCDANKKSKPMQIKKYCDANKKSIAMQIKKVKTLRAHSLSGTSLCSTVRFSVHYISSTAFDSHCLKSQFI